MADAARPRRFIGAPLKDFLQHSMHTTWIHILRACRFACARPRFDGTQYCMQAAVRPRRRQQRQMVAPPHLVAATSWYRPAPQPPSVSLSSRSAVLQHAMLRRHAHCCSPAAGIVMSVCGQCCCRWCMLGAGRHPARRGAERSHCSAAAQLQLRGAQHPDGSACCMRWEDPQRQERQRPWSPLCMGRKPRPRHSARQTLPLVANSRSWLADADPQDCGAHSAVGRAARGAAVPGGPAHVRLRHRRHSGKVWLHFGQIVSCCTCHYVLLVQIGHCSYHTNSVIVRLPQMQVWTGQSHAGSAAHSILASALAAATRACSMPL